MDLGMILFLVIVGALLLVGLIIRAFEKRKERKKQERSGRKSARNQHALLSRKVKALCNNPLARQAEWSELIRQCKEIDEKWRQAYPEMDPGCVNLANHAIEMMGVHKRIYGWK
jgi:hypothetical protein